MKTLLTEFFNGRLYPNEIFTQTPEYMLVNRDISKEMGFWEEALSREDFKRFEDLHGLLAQSGALENEHYFSLGFQLGAVMMSEVLAAKEQLFGKKDLHL